jgi:hypothetical protein
MAGWYIDAESFFARKHARSLLVFPLSIAGPNPHIFFFTVGLNIVFAVVLQMPSACGK